MQDQANLVTRTCGTAEVTPAVPIASQTRLSRMPARPKVLRFLLALFVASLFLDRLKLFESGIQDSITSLMGYVLAATFLALRLGGLKEMKAPARFFFAFFVFTLLLEIHRALMGSAKPDPVTSFRFYM